MIAERGEAPIVEDEDVDPGQLDQQADVGAVGVRKPQGVKEPSKAPVARSIAVPAGLVGQRTGQKALADAGGPDDQDGLVLGDPAARRELANETPIKAPARRVIEGFETGVGRLELGLGQRVYAIRRFSRASHSASTRSPSRSSKANCAIAGSCC